MSELESNAPTWSEFGVEIGLRLAKARAATGLSQERIAHLAGISAYTYQKFEKGESKPGTPLNPRLSTLMALSEVLRLPISELVPQPWPTTKA